MSILHLSDTRLTHLVTHKVGNKTREEELKLSDKGTRIKQDALDYLVQYFLKHFKAEEFFNLAHPERLESNDVYSAAKSLFDKEGNLVAESQRIAQHLYDSSEHPNIKEGALHIARFAGAVLDGEELEVIGVFKTETSHPFLKMLAAGEAYEIESDRGVDIKGLDKGCLIFNTESEKGYRVLVCNADRAGQARFWNDDFLMLTAAMDDFHQTKEVMSITKEFVSERMPEEFEISKTEGIDLLNRSVAYFKENETFDRKDFAETVLQDQQVIEKYESFDESYRQQNYLEPVAEFDISEQAVKKQSKGFKSVLKLDKNFSVYVHGDRKMIERGTDDDGRKYYKLYFEDEK